MDGNFYLFTMHSSVQFCGIIQCFPQLHGTSENVFEEEMIEQWFWIDTQL